jgi:hypothetical protein
VPFRIDEGPRDPASVERLLRGLPEWFGIESAINGYVDAAIPSGYSCSTGTTASLPRST